MTVLAGAGIAVMHYVGGSDGDPEGWFSAVGFAAPFIGAGCLALVGAYRSKPGLCLAAGGSLAVMSVVSILLFPLVIPAGILAWSTRRRTADGGLAVPVLAAASLVLVFEFLVFHQDPVSWSGPNGSGSSSDIVTNFEAAVSVTVVGAAIVGSVLWSDRSIRDHRWQTSIHVSARAGDARHLLRGFTGVAAGRGSGVSRRSGT